jgi:uncharacterized membrane protein YdbT with pleckstrin-like domain
VTSAIPHTFKKSFVTYIGLGIGTLVALAIAIGGASVTDGWVRFGFIILALLIIPRAIYMFFYLRTIRWEVTDDAVIVRRGILSWRKVDFAVPYETIFEAYYKHGFFGHLFNHAECTLRRSEGSTTTLSETRMHDAKTLVALVNSKLATSRRSPDARPTAPAAAVAAVAAVAQTGVEGLTELARLRNNGDITADEYEVMKARLVQG